MFARLTNHQGFHVEMNVRDNKWMSRVTSHVGLREALDQITPRRIDEALTLAHETMKGAGFANPRIGHTLRVIIDGKTAKDSVCLTNFGQILPPGCVP